MIVFVLLTYQIDACSYDDDPTPSAIRRYQFDILLLYVERCCRQFGCFFTVLFLGHVSLNEIFDFRAHTCVKYDD